MTPALIYCANATYGGWVTFTAHLAHKLGGSIFKIGNRIETRARPFGYGFGYQNITLDAACTVLRDPWIVAVDKHHLATLEALHARANVVIHDPNEITPDTIPFLRTAKKVIVIRKAVQHLLAEKHGIESEHRWHPFHPYPVSNGARAGAVSTSRIDFDKHTDIILAANALLRSAGSPPIKIYGAVNRMYVYHKLGEELFDPDYAGTFAKSFTAVSKILAGARFMIDMSAIKNDGGGTQYTFLEAIHNHTPVVLNRKWLKGRTTEECDMRENFNCFAAETGAELADVLMKTRESDITRVVTHATELLGHHVHAVW